MPDQRVVVIDAGPLVAFLAENEPAHLWVVDQFRELSPPLLTCEPVLAEAFHLLRRQPNGVRLLFELLATGILSISFSVQDEHGALFQLMQKYRDLPMSLADACLVRMVELHPDSSVLTLDSHFHIYRKNGRQQIPLITPK